MLLVIEAMMVLADKALTKFVKSHWSVLVSFDQFIVSQGFCQSHGFRKLGSLSIRSCKLLSFYRGVCPCL